jgi:magnesium-transporting ATPase (P-type)
VVVLALGIGIAQEHDLPCWFVSFFSWFCSAAESAWWSAIKAAVGYEAAPSRITAEQAAAAAAEANNTSRDSENDGTPKEELALLVDGISLEGLWASDELKIKFVEAVQNIPTVIACRVSPLQKAALVRMIKASPEAPVTLAIGDGANDVGMIHESRVGVGISGKEGRHAANSADFAISQFSFIITLMFHHGRFNYIRCSKLVLYSFFKNLLIVSLLFYYCTYSGFSGTMPMDSIVFSGYNFYLGLPILAVAALDFDIPREDVLKFPRLAYATGRNGEMLNIKNMTKWCIFAFLQGLLLFVIAMRFVGGPSYITSSSGAFQFDIYGTGMNTVGDGWGMGLYPEGFLLYSVAVVAMQYKVVAMSVTPNYIFWALWILSFLGYILFVYVYGLFPTLDWYNTVPLALGQPLFWLAVLLIPLAMVVSDYIVDSVWSVRDPSSRDELLVKLAEEERMRSREKDRSSCTNGVVMRTLSNTSAAQRPPSMH